MDFLTQILAKLFDSFKANNPKVAAIIIFVLGVFLYAAQNGLPELAGMDMDKIVQWIVFILAALQGSRTTGILNGEPPKK